MSSLIFAHAKSIRKKMMNAKVESRHIHYPTDERGYRLTLTLEEEKEIDKKANELAKISTMNAAIDEFREIMKIAKKLHEIYVEETGLETTNCYFVTIRPNEKLINFNDFKTLVFKYLKRKCIDSWTLSFEQKGNSLETLGQGFHAHIIIWPVNGRWRSQGEILRDTQRTFAKCTSDNNVDIKTTREPQKIIDNYLINYVSNDGHKKLTKQWDMIWRENLGLSSLYNSDEVDALRASTELSTSPVTVQFSPEDPVNSGSPEKKSTGSNIVIWD